MSDRIPTKYRHDEEIIRLTIEQLKKDFGANLPELKLSGDKEKLFDELAIQLAENLRALRRKGPALLQSILYRVDVSENEIPDTSKADFYHELAAVVLQREFQKVLTRRFFDQNR